MTGEKREAHTPGPWRADCVMVEIGGSYGRWQFNISAPERVVAEVIAGKAEFEANARLIAAAPEMLSALRDLVECLYLAERNNDLPLPFAGYGYDFITKARAAIAKATGEAS